MAALPFSILLTAAWAAASTEGLEGCSGPGWSPPPPCFNLATLGRPVTPLKCSLTSSSSRAQAPAEGSPRSSWAQPSRPSKHLILNPYVWFSHEGSWAARASPIPGRFLSLGLSSCPSLPGRLHVEGRGWREAAHTSAGLRPRTLCGFRSQTHLGSDLAKNSAGQNEAGHSSASSSTTATRTSWCLGSSLRAGRSAEPVTKILASESRHIQGRGHEVSLRIAPQ